MLPIAGTIRNSVRLTAMENKWQQRKQEITKTLKEKYGITEKTQGVQEYVHYQVELEQIRENRDQAEISAKIQSGAALTPEEIAYLKAKNPQLYKAYEESKREEKAYEKELEHCETKEDVEKKKQIKMGEFLSQVKSIANNPNIPEGAKLAQLEKIHAKAKMVEKVHEKFVKSSAYLSLPTEEEKREKEEKEGNTVKRSDDSFALKKQGENGLATELLSEEQKEDGAGLSPGEQEEEQSTASYEEVAGVTKEFIENHRPAGAGLDVIRSIRAFDAEKTERRDD